MVETASQLAETLASIKEQRKAGELDAMGYYRALLMLLQQLSESLIDELDGISDDQVRTQIPLLLVILDGQIGAFKERG